jgi:hypothetical protein
MPRLPGLYQWNAQVTKHFPHLSKPMAAGLALWSLGIVLAKSCSLTAVAWALVPLLGQGFYTLRERLRDLYREAPAKVGARRHAKRTHLDVATCWAPWLRWVLCDWRGQQLALALDATSLGDRFTVLVISVLYRGCAVPVAWAVLPAATAGSWEPHWKALLEHFRGAVPADWTVIVLADRGLYAKWLFQAITGLGWHPLLRINSQGRFRPDGWHHWRPLTDLVSEAGRRFQGRGVAFKNAPGQLSCTLLGCWDAGHREPWLVVTDLPPEAADVCWYGMRAWIENGFKRLKRAGWQWQYTRMDDPQRAERLWLALAIATWWLLSGGGRADPKVKAETMAEAPRTQTGRRFRLVGIFRLGWNRIMACLLHQQPIPLACGAPEPWPKPDEPAPPPPTETKSLQL